ncbi:CpaF family protein [Paralimibaculum aggregatum]|uniref:CpaF family protein n=1 Tax=Paralimibaculum aggregatum TaxID=3036245 RepID=A0ABQ6LI21_9RHOB|nr:CpaF family protein [Limibaculum sp. NKW23]GMG82938.1 CpaF family protein [Limibaculum sp. NKW23]
MFRRIRTEKDEKAEQSRASIMRRPERPHSPEQDAKRLGVELPVQQGGHPGSELAEQKPNRFALATKREASPQIDEAEAKRRNRLLGLRVELHGVLLDTLNLSAIEKVPLSELKAEIADISREHLADSDIVLNKTEFEQLIENLVHETVGLGPLEPLLADDTVTDILVNTHEQCYVERGGKLVKTDVQFKDGHHLMRIINKIVSAVGRRVDESQPWVDARLADGSRVNAIVPPCAVDGPLLSIRKFSKKPLTVEKLISNGAFSEEMALFLHACVRTRLNVLVSGGTGSGKTTNLNALSSFISNDERILTIEDTAELQLQQEHVGRLESRPANIEGTGAVTQRDLLKNALRMRPDRIIVGETRGEEVIDMLQAMNTGHDGSMTTIHANSPRDSLARIENMVGMSGVELPLKALRANIASALNLIVQVSRMSDGARRMVSISEVVGMEGDIVTMQEIFKFERHGVDSEGRIRGKFVATGIRSQYADRFKQWGYELPATLFRPDI